jgi:hypothetical protein
VIRPALKRDRGMILRYPTNQRYHHLPICGYTYINPERSHRADHVESMKYNLSNSHRTLWSAISLAPPYYYGGRTDST